MDMDTEYIIIRCIEQYIDPLVKTNGLSRNDYVEASYDSEFTEERNACLAANMIALIIDYDFTNLNTDTVIHSFSKTCGCSREQFTDALEKYIAEQDSSLWTALSMDKAPSAEALIDHIITKHAEGFVYEVKRSVNSVYMDFTSMLFEPVIKMWKTKWVSRCKFCVKMYDIHNGLVETSEYCSDMEALAFACSKIKEKPHLYSRYVILVRTPFNKKHDVVFLIDGGFSAHHICRTKKDVRAWRAVFYDYADRKINAVASYQYMSKDLLMNYARKMGAIYYVLTYCRYEDDYYTFQYFRTVEKFRNPDAARFIEKAAFKDM